MLTPADESHAEEGHAGQFSVHGQRANANYFTVDGVSANIAPGQSDLISQQAGGSVPGLTTFGGTNNLVSVDALQEFRIQTSTFAPEFGRTPGGQVSLVTRSGTRDFHGSLFEYFRNDALDANDWFANRNGQKKAALRQNDFGGTASGPVILPRFGEGGRRLLRGKNTFFFSYEGLRLRQPVTAVTVVPSLSLRQAAHPSVRPVVNAFPLPTGPEIGTTGQSPFSGTFSNPSTLNATSVRLDHSINGGWTVFGRYNDAPSTSTTRATGNLAQLSARRLSTRTLTFGATGVFSGALANEFRLNFSKAEGTTFTSLDNFGGAEPVDVSLLRVPPEVSQPLGIFSIGSSMLFTVGPLVDNTQRQFNVTDSVTYARGAHTLKLGVDYRRLSPVFTSKAYTQGHLFLSNQSVINGRATLASVVAIRQTEPLFHNFSAYAQDTWRATTRLTFTYGVRWEVNPPPTEATGLQPFVVRGLEDIRMARLAPLGTPLWETPYDSFAPRAGVAYQLSARPGRETMLRAGAGLFYDLGNTQGGDAFTQAPFVSKFGTVFNAPFPLPPGSNAPPPFPTDATTSSIYTFVADLKLPRTWQWNLALEQSLGQNQTISASYVAALGRRLLRTQAYNGVNPNLSFFSVVDNGATSDYHGLELQFQRRFSRGLQALASYTWAHAIDEVSDQRGGFGVSRGNADFDVRHNFAAALSYDIPTPFARGAARAVLGRWSVDAIVHSQSAYPLTVVGGIALVNGEQVSVRADLLPGVPLYLDDSAAAGGRRLNRTAFRAPAPGTQGSLGRNTLRGFPLHQVDLSLRREFPLWERSSLQFKADVFNVFNHPNFSPPVNNLTNALFGQSTQMLARGLGGLSPVFQLGGPRSVQFALKFQF